VAGEDVIARNTESLFFVVVQLRESEESCPSAAPFRGRIIFSFASFAAVTLLGGGGEGDN